MTLVNSTRPTAGWIRAAALSTILAVGFLTPVAATAAHATPVDSTATVADGPPPSAETPDDKLPTENPTIVGAEGIISPEVQQQLNNTGDEQLITAVNQGLASAPQAGQRSAAPTSAPDPNAVIETIDPAVQTSVNAQKGRAADHPSHRAK